MSLYIYAIVERESRPAVDWRGLDGSELSTVTFRSLAAVVSEISTVPDRDPPALMQHEAVIEAFGERHRTLPVRFGTVLPDATEVREALSERYDSLAADLATLGDKVELGLLALWRSGREDSGAPREHAPAAEASRESAPPRGDGARYLQSRQAAYAHEEAGRIAACQLARELELAMHSHVLDHRVSIVGDARLALRATYLVAPADVTTLREIVDELRRRRSDVAIILTGPWPPYSFVSDVRGTGIERHRSGCHAG